jgi:hypothetical protein
MTQALQPFSSRHLGGPRPRGSPGFTQTLWEFRRAEHDFGLPVLVQILQKLMTNSFLGMNGGPNRAAPGGSGWEWMVPVRATPAQTHACEYPCPVVVHDIRIEADGVGSRRLTDRVSRAVRLGSLADHDHGLACVLI